MANIRIMEAKIGTVYAEVDVPFLDSTFLPRDVIECMGDIYTQEETARVLMEQAQTDTERKDYARYAAVLKWAKTCNANVRSISLLVDGNGKYVQVEFTFYDVDSLVAFKKDFKNSVKGASI